MKRRWVRLAGGSILGVVALLGVTKVVIEVRDRADPVDVADVVADFDASASASETEPTTRGETVGQGPTRPPAGVWSYEASGSEYVDILGGPVHTFPDVVAQTVTDTECGTTIELTLFEQRSDVLDMCQDADGALLLERFTTRHEFVGVKDETVTDQCAPIAIWWPSMNDDVGSVESADCTADGDNAGVVPALVTREIVGTELVTVAGEPVETIHIRLTSTVATPADPTHGTYDTHLWFSRDDGVIIKRTLDADVSASTPLGSVGFQEEFELIAQSLVPASAAGAEPE